MTAPFIAEWPAVERLADVRPADTRPTAEWPADTRPAGEAARGRVVRRAAP
jgi:hypothetical protein